jgi:hypothetical protein
MRDKAVSARLGCLSRETRVSRARGVFQPRHAKAVVLALDRPWHNPSR